MSQLDLARIQFRMSLTNRHELLRVSTGLAGCANRYRCHHRVACYESAAAGAEADTASPL